MTSYPNYRVSVEIVCRQNGKILLMKRSSDCAVAPNVWNVPAGKIKYDEIPFDAAHRELMEETKMKALSLKEINCRAATIKSNGEEAYRLYFTYLAEISEEQDVQMNDEHSEFVWLVPEEILLEKYSSLNECLKKIILEKI